MAKYPSRYDVMNNGDRNRGDKIMKRAFDDTQANLQSSLLFEEIPLSKIHPRSINKYSQTRIKRLADSIMHTNGRLIHPIIVAKISELRALQGGSPVIKEFDEKNVDLTGYEYIIVAGERRFRAFQYLHEEEVAKRNGRIGEDKFDIITANVLKPEELVNEEVFYKDSNNQARQLTPVEAMLHVKDALDAVNTEEKKKIALKEMGKDPDQENFIQDEYVAYYLLNELGIDGWSASTIKTYSSIINNCDSSVIDAIMAGEFSSTAARELPKLDANVQKELLLIYKDQGPAAFQEKVKEIKLLNRKKSKKTNDRYLYMDARDNLKPFLKKLEKERSLFNEILVKMSGDDKAAAKVLLKKMDGFIDDVKDCLSTYTND